MVTFFLSSQTLTFLLLGMYTVLKSILSFGINPDIGGRGDQS